ncbi:MAG TPA: acylneuraminate cytidylyltransferase family protein [Pirellulales bacterium]|jgi:CMP-N,N'-diacetyllegionaminic acid synthase|nr:acylneuraminate cytidylyltransferase family protein [Pirellulales bacterium]
MSTARNHELQSGHCLTMFVLGIVPARAGSKRLPRKNLRPLAGKPLAAWAIDAARGAKRIDRLVVSSDDEEVLDLAAVRDSRFSLRRPAELCTDTSPAIDYVVHALHILEGAGRPRFDAVAIVQPSSPLTLPSDIDAAIDLLQASGADTVVSVAEVAHDLHPAKFKVMKGNRLLPYFEEEAGRMAAHELPRVYVRNCSVYVTHREVIERGNIIGDDCRGYIMPRERSIDINDEMDLAFAEFLLSHNCYKDPIH